MLVGCDNTNNTEIPQQGSTDFMSYGGAVFPLSLMTPYEGITATRNIVFDFNNFGRTDDEGFQMLHNDIRVTSNYYLTNDTEADKIVTVVYPFAANFGDLTRLLPSMIINGAVVDTNLRAGDWMEIKTWRDYISYLYDGSYFQQAIGAVHDLNQQVIVYEFTNAQTDETNAIAPTLAASFNMDFDRTEILTYGFNGAVIDQDNNFMRQAFFLPSGDGRSHFLIFIGDDITNLSLQGYGNGALSRGDEIDVSVDVKRFEAVLGDVWQLLLYDFSDSFATNDWHSPHEAMKTDLFFNASATLLHDTQESEIIPRRIFFAIGTLEDLFSHTLWSNRFFYLTTEVTIPAGESIAIDVNKIRPGSFDFPKARQGTEGLNGYDMFLVLGSNLIFNSISAEIIGTERIEIVRNNFGFDANSVINNVNLNMEEQHFYIEVRNASRN